MQSKSQLKGVKKGRDQLWLSILARCPSDSNRGVRQEGVDSTQTRGKVMRINKMNAEEKML